MKYRITAPQALSCHIELPASKSISNRALIIDALGGFMHNIDNLASCNDTRVMIEALSSTHHTLDVGEAGTAMRFLTAYYAITPGEKVITGSARMLQRPIAPLVDALQQAGASVSYLGKVGSPPLRIEGGTIRGGKITIRGDISSQFISALLLIAPYMQEGLSLTIEGNILSRPYIDMTIAMMKYYDIHIANYYNRIDVYPGQYNCNKHYSIPFDWSAASYWYEIAYLNRSIYYLNRSYRNTGELTDYFNSSLNQDYPISYYDISLKCGNNDKIDYDNSSHNYNNSPDCDNSISRKDDGLIDYYNSTKDFLGNMLDYDNSLKNHEVGILDHDIGTSCHNNSQSNYDSSTADYFTGSSLALQGDEKVTQMFGLLSVETIHEESHIVIAPNDRTPAPDILRLDLQDTPDLAQTIIVSCVLKKQFFIISGLHNLPLKETNRIEALISETAKLGVILTQPVEGTLQWLGESCPIHYPIVIDTHNDHRMAMAFAPAAITHGEVWIDNPQVVDKSYPSYWQDLIKAGFCITDQQGKEITICHL